MKTICKFVLFKVTPGALQYKQTEENGQPVGRDNNDKLIGTLYLRKAKVEGQPEVVMVTVEV